MEMGSSSSLKTCFILLFFCLLNVFTISSKPLSKESVLFGGNFPALYVIGDSLVDSGNNNHLDTLAKSNFPPYGSDFEGGKSTGRFGNGKTIADYIGKNKKGVYGWFMFKMLHRYKVIFNYADICITIISKSDW